MASWMVHLRIADELLPHLNGIDEPAFVMGNMAPDSGVPNEDWSEFHPPRSVTHFKTSTPAGGGIDTALFCAGYFHEEAIRRYGREEYSFFLGYYVHLLTDVRWSEEVYGSLKTDYPKEYAQNKRELVRAAKEDWYDLDFLYLEQHPDFRAFSVYENAKDFANTFMDLFGKDAFENRRRYICGFYHSAEHGDLHREYRFLTPEQADSFVKDTSGWLLEQIREKLPPAVREHDRTGPCDRLRRYLQESGERRLSLRFDQIAGIAGAPFDGSFLAGEEEWSASGYPPAEVSPQTRTAVFQRTELRSERLLLTPCSRGEMEQMIREEKDEDLQGAYRQMLDGALENPRDWVWYATWRILDGNGAPLGDLCFKGIGNDGTVEIGYGVLEACRNRGVATEAVRTLVDWARKQPRVRRIEAETAPENAASRRVLAKCGFVPTGTMGEEGPRFVWAGPLPEETKETS